MISVSPISTGLNYAELAGYGNLQRTDWVVAVGEV